MAGFVADAVACAAVAAVPNGADSSKPPALRGRRTGPSGSDPRGRPEAIGVSAFSGMNGVRDVPFTSDERAAVVRPWNGLPKYGVSTHVSLEEDRS
jgi:hypothetical protein